MQKYIGFIAMVTSLISCALPTQMQRNDYLELQNVHFTKRPPSLKRCSYGMTMTEEQFDRFEIAGTNVVYTDGVNVETYTCY